MYLTLLEGIGEGCCALNNSCHRSLQVRKAFVVLSNVQLILKSVSFLICIQ